jgi:hypothetical protein
MSLRASLCSLYLTPDEGVVIQYYLRRGGVIRQARSDSYAVAKNLHPDATDGRALESESQSVISRTSLSRRIPVEDEQCYYYE